MRQMLRNGLVFDNGLSLQIEILVGPPRPRHSRPTISSSSSSDPGTTLSLLPFSPVIAISNDASPYDIQSQSFRIRRRWDFSNRADRMKPRSFNLDPRGEGLWEDDYGNEEEGGKWKGWRRRRRKNGWKWRRRRRPREKWTFQDAFWIFKVLRPYGWSLPLIVLSWLAALGPKALFVSLALSIALSAVALVVRFLWPGAELGSLGSELKRKRRSVGRVSRGEMAGGRNSEKRSGQKHSSAYDSWLESDLAARELGLNDPSLGGWAALVEERFPDESPQVTGRPRKGGIESSEESRKSSREAKAEAPLLLRLLVAMFPFMASWTKLFW